MDGLAKEVHDLIAGLPPESAKIVMGMLVNEAFHYDLGDYDVSKAYLEHQSKQLEDIKKGVIRSYVAKRQAGESVDSLVALAEAIAKADMGPLNRPEEEFDPKKHPRGYHGRWKNSPGKALHNDKGERARAIDTAMAVSRAAESSAGYLRSSRYTNEGDNEAFVPGVQNYRRLQAGANFLQATAGGYMPPSAQLGLHAAGFVGQYGPVAQQAFGPAVDRAKYRYKGVERKLDKDLVESLQKDKAYSKEGFDDFVVRGEEVPTARRPGQRIGRTQWQPSNTMDYFRQHLPNPKLAALQRMSGHQPPSEGIILDANGHPSTQMVGHGDDWYLPFDLRNLGNLKGGQYIRTRTNGGLTTEDVYTGLMAGARQMSVVSHNGVYSMTFDDSLRGSRRYSQAARQMTERYGQLLDAVKNGDVRYNSIYDVDPDKVMELRQQADGDASVYQALRDAYYTKPTPSQAKQRQWADNFLTEQAEDFDTKDGREMTGHEFVQQKVIPAMMAESMRASVIPGGPPDPFLNAETARAQAELTLQGDPMQGVRALGLNDKYREYANRQLDDYQAQLAPMEINGPGYDYAAKALKEQFPYFIKDTKYIPLQRGGKDFGYVMPRYNRSADVRAGYLDTQITGFGKVPANRTRFQNSRITNTVEQGWRPGGVDRKVTQETAASGGSQGGGEGAKAPARPGGERRSADMTLIRRFLEKQNIGKDWHRTGYDPVWMAQQRGGPVAPHTRPGNPEQNQPAGWWNNDDQYKIFTKGIGEFEDMSDDELHSAAQKMYDIVHRDKLFDIDDEDRKAIARFQGGGKVPLRKTGEIEAILIDKPDNFDPAFSEDLDFEDAKPGMKAQEYSSAYLNHQGIRKLFNNGKLPADIKDPALPDMAADYIDDQLDRLMAAQESGNNGISHVQNIMTALLGHQLHRMYMRARGVGGASAAPGQILPGGGGGEGGAPVPASMGHLIPLSEMGIPGYNSMNN